MAGFIISVSKKADLKKIISEGIYASQVPKNINNTRGLIVFYSTLSDYLSMKENDNIYFLKERKIYGVGKIIKTGNDCILENYPYSTLRKTNSTKTCIYKPRFRSATTFPWICRFIEDDVFFQQGVDMDDVLKYKPDSFRMLRAFQDRTFIKIDDEENLALKQYLYLKNKNKVNTEDQYNFKIENYKIKGEYNIQNHKIKLKELIKENINNSGELRLEMLLEAYMVNLINQNEFLGLKWDYVSHQVIASPFKPLSYIDKMDVFAYKYLDCSLTNRPIEKYLVLELKKGNATNETISQTMKYVDWICEEYASGDYSSIKAAIIAKNYSIKNEYKEETQRTYIASTHPTIAKKWNDFTCLQYNCSENGDIDFEKYNYFDSYKFLLNELQNFGFNLSKKTFSLNKNHIKPIASIKDYKIIFVEKGKNTIGAYEILKNNGWEIHELEKRTTKEDIKNLINKMIVNHFEGK